MYAGCMKLAKSLPLRRRIACVGDFDSPQPCPDFIAEASSIPPDLALMRIKQTDSNRWGRSASVRFR